MRLNEGGQRVFLICIRCGSCEVWRLTWALGAKKMVVSTYRVFSFKMSTMGALSNCLDIELKKNKKGGKLMLTLTKQDLSTA